MKKLLVINPHSVIDIITNSSTELFICDKKHTLEMVKEILKTHSEVQGYVEPWIFNLKEYREWRKSQKQSEKDLILNHNFHMITGWFKDIEDEEDLEYLRKHFIDYGNASICGWPSDINTYYQRLKKAEQKAREIEENKDNYHAGDEARQSEINKIYNQIKKSKNKPDWWNNSIKYYYNEIPVSDLDGCVIILGDDDNSFECEIMDWIESTFNANRYHLG